MPLQFDHARETAREHLQRKRLRLRAYHNAIVDIVREAGMVRLRDLSTSRPALERYADEVSARKALLPQFQSGFFPALELVEINPRKVRWKDGSRYLVFWRPLLDQIRKAR
jgi:hypothetical protein